MLPTLHFPLGFIFPLKYLCIHNLTKNSLATRTHFCIAHLEIKLESSVSNVFLLLKHYYESSASSEY